MKIVHLCLEHEDQYYDLTDEDDAMYFIDHIRSMPVGDEGEIHIVEMSENEFRRMQV